MSNTDKPYWEVEIKGERCSDSWEISVIRSDNKNGYDSWGWFGAEKLLISHNGGPCRWPIKGFVFDQQTRIAKEVARRLNNGESINE